MARKAIYTPLSVPQKTKELLKQLRKNGVFSYAQVIEYLLIRAGHLDQQDSDMNYDAVDKFINEE